MTKKRRGKKKSSAVHVKFQRFSSHRPQPYSVLSFLQFDRMRSESSSRFVSANDVSMFDRPCSLLFLVLMSPSHDFVIFLLLPPLFSLSLSLCLVCSIPISLSLLLGCLSCSISSQRNLKYKIFTDLISPQEFGSSVSVSVWCHQSSISQPSFPLSADT